MPVDVGAERVGGVLHILAVAHEAHAGDEVVGDEGGAAVTERGLDGVGVDLHGVDVDRLEVAGRVADHGGDVGVDIFHPDIDDAGLVGKVGAEDAGAPLAHGVGRLVGVGGGDNNVVDTERGVEAGLDAPDVAEEEADGVDGEEGDAALTLLDDGAACPDVVVGNGADAAVGASAGVAKEAVGADAGGAREGEAGDPGAFHEAVALGAVGVGPGVGAVGLAVGILRRGRADHVAAAVAEGGGVGHVACEGDGVSVFIEVLAAIGAGELKAPRRDGDGAEGGLEGCVGALGAGGAAGADQVGDGVADAEAARLGGVSALKGAGLFCGAVGLRVADAGVDGAALATEGALEAVAVEAHIEVGGVFGSGVCGARGVFGSGVGRARGVFARAGVSDVCPCLGGCLLVIVAAGSERQEQERGSEKVSGHGREAWSKVEGKVGLASTALFEVTEKRRLGFRRVGRAGRGSIPEGRPGK